MPASSRPRRRPHPRTVRDDDPLGGIAALGHMAAATALQLAAGLCEGPERVAAEVARDREWLRAAACGPQWEGAAP